MDCELSQRHLDAYVDGELSPSSCLELEAHVGSCDICQAHVAFARRLKRTLRQELAAPPAPASVRLNVLRALERGESRRTTRRRVGQGAGWASLAAAAAATLVWFSVQAGGPSWAGVVDEGHPASSAGMRQASIFGDIVNRHQDTDPAEIATPEPESAEQWFSGKLRFRVQPVAFEEPQVRLIGARLSHVGRHRAAKLYYDVGNRRVTAVAFEATPEIRGLLEEGRPDVQVVRIGNRVVRYHRVHGYTVPIIEHDGVVYGFTGDLDERHMLRLVGSVRLR